MKTTERKAVCPKCGKIYLGFPAISRVDNRSEICPECGIHEALDCIGMSAAEQERLLALIREQATKDPT